MSPSNPANHTSRPWQQTVLLACDSKSSVLTEMAGGINPVVYSPYGQQPSRQEVMTHLGFNGELREAGTDWYFLGNGYRVFNPRLMRFQSPDKFSPFGKGGMNAYAYCGGEPVNRVDPTGEGWWFERFADFMQILSGVGPSGGGNWGRTGITLATVSTSRPTFDIPSRLKRLGKSRKQPSAFSDNNSATKSVHWAPDTKEPTTSTKTTTSTAAQSETMSRSPSSSSISSNFSSVSTPSTVSTVSTLSIHSHDSGYASSAGSIRSNPSADQHIQERLNALRQN